VYGAEEITTGASGDLQQVANIARRMVTQWGYSKDKIGAVAWEIDGSNWAGPKAASAATEERIDEEVKALVNEAYVRCKQVLTDDRDLIEELVELLIEKETVDYKELAAMVVKYHPELEEQMKAAPPASVKSPA